MLSSSCKCTVFQSRLLGFKLECMCVSPGQLVKWRFCFRRPGVPPKNVYSSKCQMMSMLLIHGPDSETKKSKGLHHQLCLASKRDKNVKLMGGSFCGTGLEMTLLISAHFWLTRAQKMVTLNFWEAGKCRLTVFSGGRKTHLCELPEVFATLGNFRY